jgi:hypothetical protein
MASGGGASSLAPIPSLLSKYGSILKGNPAILVSYTQFHLFINIDHLTKFASAKICPRSREQYWNSPIMK